MKRKTDSELKQKYNQSHKKVMRTSVYAICTSCTKISNIMVFQYAGT